MKPSIYVLALAPALVAGTCLILSASSSGAQDVAPADNRIIMSGPGRISGEQAGADTEVERGTQTDAGANVEAEPEVEPEPEVEAEAEAVAPAGGTNTMSGPGRLSQARAAAEEESAAEVEAQAEEEADPLEKPVSYTNEQAARGEREYQQECVECHGSDLRGGLLGGPPLRGVVFEEHWGGGMPASALHSYMSATMPPNAPGRLSASEYAEIQAYLLKRNGYQSGAPLPADLDALDYLIMEK